MFQLFYPIFQILILLFVDSTKRMRTFNYPGVTRHAHHTRGKGTWNIDRKNNNKRRRKHGNLVSFQWADD